MDDDSAQNMRFGFKDIVQTGSIFVAAIGAVFYISGMMSSLEAKQQDQEVQIEQLQTAVQSLQTLSYANNASIASLDQSVADNKAQTSHGIR
jgi:hypothetical protein